MSVYETNECCSCASPGYPCIGDACSLRHVIHYKCDCCGADDLNKEDVIEMSDGIHFCKDCYEEQEGGEDES